MSKLTVEDLVRSQQETQKHLCEISASINALVNSTQRTKTYGDLPTYWFMFGSVVCFFCQANEMAKASLSSVCLFIIAGLLMGRERKYSPIDEVILRQKEMAEEIKKSHSDNQTVSF